MNAADVEIDVVLDRLGPLAKRDVSLAPMCTYRVGGPASGTVEVSSVDVLEAVHSALIGASHVPLLVVGRGSNLLVADRGFRGLVLRLGEAFERVEIDTGRCIVDAGSAALLPVVARKTASAGLAGFEWAVGVPGSIGGAVRMNAGGHGADMADSLLRATTYSLRHGDVIERSVEDLELGYRRSSIAADEVVLSARLQLRHGDRETSEAELSDIVRWRRAHQPGGQNAGSVFANPPDDSAGRLIEAAGLKGHRIGSAHVSEKHANFIQADPDGSADDVFELIRHLQRRVRDTFGIELRTENVLVGFDDRFDGEEPKASPEASADE